jgi:hypothetical protein
MSKNSKKDAKKKAHEREARKRVLERRKALRQERKDDKLREEAFEREFSKKQNLGLTNEQIKEKLEHNMKILEALENELVAEDENRKKYASEAMKAAQENMAKLKETVEIEDSKVESNNTN